MTKTIQIKINAEVPEGTDPKFVACQIFHQLALRALSLESWQKINAPVGYDTIGECHFEVVDEEDE